ncbi:MAG: citrate synthase [Rubrivivax sp.]|nr:citrate synthase [Rubrivivax sp.]
MSAATVDPPAAIGPAATRGASALPGTPADPRPPTASGLEGVVVADTVLSDVDGEHGRLLVRGHDIEALAGRHDFESVCALLWTGELPAASAAARWRAALGRARVEAAGRLPGLGDALAATDAMDALRAAMAHLQVPEPDTRRGRREPEDFAGPLALVGATAVFAAAWARRQRGEPPLAPDASLGHAADFLRLATGAGFSAEAHSAARAAALDAYLVTAADHGMNASTFTARVVASTRSDSVSAVVAALGALKGPLHGGAPGPVLAMLDAIGEPARAAPWIAERLAAGERIMGMGHRVYRVRDPRAAVLERAVERLHAAGVQGPAAAGPHAKDAAAGSPAGDRLALARAVEAVATASLHEHRPERRLAANVEFYTAVVLDAVGLPQELFTAVFAAARVAGWLAHVQEQRAEGRLIRPASRYVGPVPAAAPA